MSPIDPAWFYSSLAQSAAAIVGLIGAMFGARLLDHLQFMRGRQRALIETVLRDVQEAVAPTRQRLSEHEFFVTQESIATRQAIEKGDQERKYVQKIGWGFTDGTRQVTMSTAVLEEELRAERRILREFSAAYPRFEGLVGDLSNHTAAIEDLLPRLPERHPAVHVAENDLRWLQRLERELNALRADLLPRPFLMVFVLLAFVSAGCILWPLAALPGYPDGPMQQRYPKAVMWGLLLVGLAGLYVYVGYLLKELYDLGRVAWIGRRSKASTRERR